MQKFICDVCQWEYDPAVGYPEGGIPAGTPFEELPDDFECPLCGVGKDQFSPVAYLQTIPSPPIAFMGYGGDDCFRLSADAERPRA